VQGANAAPRCTTHGALTLQSRPRGAQDPGESGDFAEDATTAALLSLLECDKHKDVRRAVVASVGVSSVTIPALVERTRDVAEEVRRTAFLTLAAKVSLGALSIAARATLLRRGLADRAPDVRAAALVMLGKWMDGACGLAREATHDTCSADKHTRHALHLARCQSARATWCACWARWTWRRTRRVLTRALHTHAAHAC
jgi:hypothetical protein